MPKQILYSATQPLASGDLANKLRNVETHGKVPYFVSFPVSENKTDPQYVFGLLAHVGAWICAIIFDAMAGSKIDSKVDKELWDYWLYNIIILGAGFGVIVIALLVHMMKPITPKAMMPAFLSVITISGTLCTLFCGLLLLKHDDLAKDKDEKDLRHFLIWGLIAKLYASACVRNNVMQGQAFAAAKEAADEKK